MRHHASRKRATHWVAVGILLLGAVLRLAAFDETLIEPDQAAILGEAFEIAWLNYFPLIGMKSSVGVMQTGVTPLLAAIPLFFVKRSIAVQWFFSALDLLALAWLYRTVRSTLGRRAAWVAALLYATAPWIVLYARIIWYQSLVAAFATVAFGGVLILLSPSRKSYAVESAMGKRDVQSQSVALFLAMVSTTLMSMVHLAAAPWGVMLFVFYVVIAWRRRLWRAAGAGIVASLIITLPYLIYLFISSFADLLFILRAGGESQGLNTSAFRLSRELVSGAMIVANAHGDLWDRSVILWDSGPTLLLVLLGLALVWAVWRAVTSRRDRPWLFFALVWLLAVPSLFLFSGIHLQHFYLMMLFPAPFVLLGAWIEACARGVGAMVGGTPWLTRLWRILGYLASVLLVLIAAWWASLWLVRIRLEAQGELQRHTRGWLMDRAAVTVAHYLDEEPEGQVIVLAQYERDMSPFEWLRGYIQRDGLRVVEIGRGFIIPAGPTCYLLGPGVSRNVLSPVAHMLVERPDMTIPANPPWPIFCKPASGEPPAALGQWENGMRLVDSAITGEFRAEGRLELVHTWVYRAIKPGPYHFYNHLLLDGELVAQIDGSGVLHWYWRDGDTLLTYFTLDLPAGLPPGDYVLRVGMYTWPDITRVLMVTGEDGYAIPISPEHP